MKTKYRLLLFTFIVSVVATSTGLIIGYTDAVDRHCTKWCDANITSISYEDWLRCTELCSDVIHTLALKAIECTATGSETVPEPREETEL